MKRLLLGCYVILILSFSIPLLLQHIKKPDIEPTPTPSAPPSRPIRVLSDGLTQEKDLEDYLIGVVAAEMPAAFPAEALKAQAVAARTYTLYCAAAKRHGEAQICSNSGCCQAWIDEEAMKERWGVDYERYRGVIKAAVESTAGEYLSYGGQAVCAAFHSSSAGATENSGSVWSAAPYLISVPSPETAETVPNLVSTVQLSPQDFAAALYKINPAADFSAAPENWLGQLTLNPGGRVESISIGGQVFSGAQLRGAFSLRSTDFELGYDGAGFVFTVYGFGHGIGMSQYGAKLLAEAGQDYKAILAHYYPGTEMSCVF